MVAYVVVVIAATVLVNWAPPRITPDLSLCKAKDVELAPSWPRGPVLMTRILYIEVNTCDICKEA